MKRMKQISGLLVVLLLITSASLQATTVRRLTLDDLVAKASSIIEGRVLDSHTFWTENRKLILTSYTIEVRENLKGPAAQSVVVTMVGGRIGSTALRVSGMPTLEVGESAIFFLEQSSSYTTVVGLKQGKFPIADGQVQDMSGGGVSSGALPEKPASLPLDRFKHQIKIRIGY